MRGRNYYIITEILLYYYIIRASALTSLPDRTQVVAWLQVKVQQAKQALRAAPSGSFASMEDCALTAYAAGMVGEYLAPPWAAKLAAAMPAAAAMDAAAVPLPDGVPADYDTSALVQQQHNSSQDAKRPRFDPKEAAKAKAAEARQAAKAAKEAKEAKTMRTLGSFFTKAAAKK